MRELLIKYKLLYLITILIYFINLSLSFENIYPLHFSQYSFFITDILGRPVDIPFWLILLASFANIFLLWKLAARIFPGYLKFVPALIYVSSFWVGFLTASDSAYILFLSFFLLILESIYLLKSGNRKFGIPLFLVSCLFIFYTTFICSLVLILALMFSLPVSPGLFKIIRPTISLLIVFLIPLLLITLFNMNSLKSSFHSDFTITSDIGIINYINDLRGQAKTKSEIFLNRLTENKYIYISRYILYKSLNNLSPANFFTAQEKMLSVSFIPPLLFGFLIPFLFGLYSVLKNKTVLKYLALSLLLTLPAVFSENEADLNRLILFLPIMLFIITSGIEVLLKKFKPIFAIFIVALLAQYIVMMFDFNLREPLRIAPLLESNSFSLGKQ